MGLFNLFRKQPQIDDSDFGHLKADKADSWSGEDFKIWGYTSIQIMLDGNQNGPTAEQRLFIKTLRTNPAIQGQIEQAIRQEAKRTTNQPDNLQLTSIYLPKSPTDQTWRVWYDIAEEDHYWYGAEITGWQNIRPFTED